MTKPQKKKSVLWIHYVYDLQNGGRAVLGWFLPAVALFVVGCAICQLSMPETLRTLGLPDRLTFLDTWFFLFQGNVGVVPITWLALQTYIAFMVLFYPVRDLGGGGAQLLIRSGRRAVWWTSKLLWAYTAVVLYYLLLAAVVAAVTGAVRGGTASPSALLIFGVVEVPGPEALWSVLLGPVLSSLAFVSLELLVSAAASPAIGFLSVLLLAIPTIFFNNPFLFGNVSMLDRNSLLGFKETVNFYHPAGIAVAVCLASWLIGKRVIDKKDILGNSEG